MFDLFLYLIFHIDIIRLFYRAELESAASKYRRSDSNNKIAIGKKPDSIMAMYIEGIKYEIVFTECSRIMCSARKKTEYSVKLWRELNDAMTWIWKHCKPPKNQFNIIGVQVFGLYS